MSQRYFAGDDDALPQPKQPALILFATRDLSHDNRHALAKMSNAKGFQKSLAKLMVPETHSDPKGLMKYVPQAGFQEIERTGHHLELESPDQVCRAIEAFVAGR